MERIIVEEKNGVCVPMKVTPIFRMVSVKERLPKDSGVYWIIGATPSPKDPNPAGIKFCSFFSAKENDFYDNAIYWLEEIELPSDEQIVKEFSYGKRSDASYCQRMDDMRKAAKWMRELVLAAAPLTACR